MVDRRYQNRLIQELLVFLRPVLFIFFILFSLLLNCRKEDIQKLILFRKIAIEDTIIQRLLLGRIPFILILFMKPTDGSGTDQDRHLIRRKTNPATILISCL